MSGKQLKIERVLLIDLHQRPRRRVAENCSRINPDDKRIPVTRLEVGWQDRPSFQRLAIKTVVLHTFEFTRLDLLEELIGLKKCRKVRNALLPHPQIRPAVVVK